MEQKHPRVVILSLVPNLSSQRPSAVLGGGMVILDLEIHELEGVPMKSLSIGMLRTVLIIKNGKREVEL